MRRLTPCIFAALLGCGAPASERAPDSWSAGQGRVRAWTGCAIPASATDTRAKHIVALNSVLDLRFEAPRADVESFVGCVRGEASLSRSAPPGTAATIPFPEDATNVRTVRLAYDDDRQWRSLDLWVAERSPDRRVVSIATVLEGAPGGVPRCEERPCVLSY